MSLIRCEYCGMSYDGDRSINCPHCMAPRGHEDDVERVLRALMDASGIYGTTDEHEYPRSPYFLLRRWGGDVWGEAILFPSLSLRHNDDVRAFESALDETCEWHGSDAWGYTIRRLRHQGRVKTERRHPKARVPPPYGTVERS